jgi:hypothetical protein
MLLSTLKETAVLYVLNKRSEEEEKAVVKKKKQLF